MVNQESDRDSCPEERRDEGSPFGVRRLGAAFLPATTRFSLKLLSDER